MKKLLFLGMGLALIFAEASGQVNKNQRLYDANTVETIEGTVLSIEKVKKEGRNYYGMHLTLANGNEEISVHLGPGWYMEKQTLQLKVNDKISVTGSRITYEDNPVIIAAIVKRGDEVLTLRDDAGFPEWRGGNRKKM